MPTREKTRLDIQALRALAVSMVVLFHFWPDVFPGGFVGVDVFFVISGYLITSHLMAQATQNGRINLAEFWARRMRRLLPSAFTVITITILLAAAFVPAAAKIKFSKEAIASVFYSENWHLAFSSTDYFAQETASPFQHYWSLAVEEQFYLLWPIALSFIVWISKARSRNLTAFVLLTFFASLAFSAWFTQVNPKFAYFSPLTRFWEFALGALIAMPAIGNSMKRLASTWSTTFSVLGFLGIATATATLNEGMLFPGLVALIPAVATALVIFGACNPFGESQQLPNFVSPINFLGNISYSLYLWHWPAILLPVYLLNESANNFLRLILLFTSILLAWLTKRYIEDPARFNSEFVSAKPSKTLKASLAVSLIISLVAVSVYQLGKLQLQRELEVTKTQSLTDGFGAKWLELPEVLRKDQGKPKLSLEQARNDGADPGAKCMTKAEDVEVKLCEFGKQDSATRVLLVGDSHAATHLGAFKQLSKLNGWKLILAYKAGCSFSLVERNSSNRGTSCLAWNKRLQKKLSNLPAFDLVITNAYAANRLADIKSSNWESLAIEGFRQAWLPLLNRGAQLVAIRDNPAMNAKMTKCWTDSVLDASACSQNISTALAPDFTQKATVGLAGTFNLDLTDLYCFAGKCPAVIGGIYVYRNPDHIGGTYDLTMSEGIAKRLREIGLDLDSLKG